MAGRSLTPSEYIARRQREHPPQYQHAAGWNALFGVALDLAPLPLRNRVASGRVASGEVGEFTPAASVTPVGRGYAIEMHSGLMRLIYSAARAMTATDSGQFKAEGAGTALTREECAAQIADLFRKYQQTGNATSQRFPATDAQKKWAHAIAIHAETFLLLHELAHVHHEDSFWRWLRVGQSVLEKEREADATSAQWLISFLLNANRDGPQRQMLYAGAEFGLRVRMAMETVGMRFEKTHPTAGNRIAALRGRFREAAGSKAFYRIANTSLAFDQMWRAIEQMLLGQAPVFTLTVEDVLASMRTLVSEILAIGDPNDLVLITEVRPGQYQVKLSLKDPRQLAMFESAREFMTHVDVGVRHAARELVGDVYDKGSLEYSLLDALLNTVQP